MDIRIMQVDWVFYSKPTHDYEQGKLLLDSKNKLSIAFTDRLRDETIELQRSGHYDSTSSDPLRAYLTEAELRIRLLESEYVSRWYCMPHMEGSTRRPRLPRYVSNSSSKAIF